MADKTDKMDKMDRTDKTDRTDRTDIERSSELDEERQDPAKKKKARTHNRRRKGGARKVITRISIGLLVLALLGAGALYYMWNNPAVNVASASSYQVVGTQVGDLSKSISGTGSLAFGTSTYATIPAGMKVDEVLVQQGERVAQGQALVKLNTDQINTQLKTLEDELTAQDSVLQGYSGEKASSTITATVKGRVKVLYGASGDDIASVMAQYGAVALLSTDGHMRVTVTVGNASALGLKVGDDMIVKLSTGKNKDGVLDAINGDQVSVVISDDGPSIGDEVTVKTDDGTLLGNGKLVINAPLRITGTVGTISSVSVSVNSSVSKGKTLYKLSNLPLSEAYQTALSRREEILADITAMKRYKLSPVITAPTSGVVQSADVGTGVELADDAQISMYEGSASKLIVNVDELDIMNISVGMQTSVTLDAYEDESFTGTVSFISAIGTTTNSVTTYPVTININADERLLPGMSASASILAEQHTGVLIVPITAINTMRGTSFVYKYTGAETTDGSIPGEMTQVTTGLSDDTYVEITSGLASGDQVVVARSAGGTSQQFPMGGMGGMGMMMGGGEPPQGMGGGRTGGGNWQGGGNAGGNGGGNGGGSGGGR